MKKIYLSSSSFCTALFDSQKAGTLVENALLSLKTYRFFWRDPYNHEVDFIETNNQTIMPTEIKYKSKIRAGDYNNLYLFCKKFRLSKAVMLMNTIEAGSVEYKGLLVETKSLFDAMAKN